MNDSTIPIRERLRHARVGTTFALLTILAGFGSGAVFGLLETSIKADLLERARAAPASVYAGDTDKMRQIAERSWTYHKRAHMHAGGIGAAALATILLLSLLERPGHRLRRTIALALGLGGVGYASSWSLAALRAPTLGDTSAAKHSIAWLAIPSSTALLLGVGATLVLLVVELYSRREAAP